MKNIFLAIAAGFCLITQAEAQDKVLLGQYFQNMPTFNPALTGANDFLDLKMGYRQQWMGFNGAPKTMYFSGYGVINPVDENAYFEHSGGSNKLPDNNREVKNGFLPGLKQGIGGNMQIDEQGPYSQLEINVNYAVHVPVSHKTYLSLGLAPGIYRSKVDFSKVALSDMKNDQAYQNILKNGESSTFFNLSGGVSLYSNRFYAAYSMMQLTHSLISGNKALNNDGAEVRHQVMGGYRFYLNQDFELVPNAFVRMERAMPVLWDGGARLQYKGQISMGVSYRNDNSLIGMLGLLYNDKVRIGYSYEHKTGTSDTFHSGSHEIILGLQLFNHSRHIPMW